MAHRNFRQLRAIKLYARSINCDFESAFTRWCETGLAQQWAKHND